MMRKQNRKIILAVLLILTLMLGLLAPGAMAATNYQLIVGGVKVTDAKLSGDGWRFQPSSFTLTLHVGAPSSLAMLTVLSALTA